LTILIVDDELMIQNWLSLLLKKTEKYPVTALTASNAKEALELCKSNTIDLIITDVNMPQVNGLELLETVRTSFPNIKTVVLSAYDNFDYVRTALKLDCLDYILKSHLCQEDINNILDKVANMSDYSTFNRKYSNEEFYNTQQYNNGFSKFFYEDDTSFDDLNSINGNLLKIKDLCLISMQLSVKLESKNAICSLIEITRNVIQLEKIIGFAYLLDNDKLIILYNSNSNVHEYRTASCKRLTLQIKGTIEKYCDLEVVHSTFYDTIYSEESLKDDVASSIRFLQYFIYYGNEIEVDSQSCIDKYSLINENASVIESMKVYLNSANIDSAKQLFFSYLDKLHNEKVFPSEIVDFSSHIISLSEIIYFPNNADSSSHKIREYINRIFQCSSKSQLEQLMHEYFDSLQGGSCKQLSVHPQIEKVLEYIRDNYNLGISLEDAAAQAYLSKNYLSSLFKNELGISFNDYVERVRIQNAKILLINSRLSISEISSDVGFSSQSYFTKIFKQHTGETPIRYRNLSLSKKDS